MGKKCALNHKKCRNAGEGIALVSVGKLHWAQWEFQQTQTSVFRAKIWDYHNVRQRENVWGWNRSQLNIVALDWWNNSRQTSSCNALLFRCQENAHDSQKKTPSCHNLHLGYCTDILFHRNQAPLILTAPASDLMSKTGSAVTDDLWNDRCQFVRDTMVSDICKQRVEAVDWWHRYVRPNASSVFGGDKGETWWTPDANSSASARDHRDSRELRGRGERWKT